MRGERQDILGVDPGIVNTGWAVVRANGSTYDLIAAGCIQPAKENATAERLHEIFRGLCNVCRSHTLNAIALEESFFGKNVKTALTIGQARAAVMLAAAEMDIPVVEYSPRVVKQAVTGQGQAVKSQVGYMVQNLLELEAVLTPEDTSDAAALALCHLLRNEMLVQR